ncbi:IS630 family transposase, partial [Pseudomonas syringae pv. actinidiae]
LFVQNLESSITTFMALRNAQPTRYVWNAKGEEILNKIQRAREALEAVQEK